jgi:3-hydroxymyristoyl/3-hydroxydecanoyl-(acyl carrier protein) dehydratase
MFKPLKDYAAPLKAFDRVIQMTETEIVAQKAVSVNEAFFSGHYPDNPIYPGVFIIETVQQIVRHHAATYYGLIKLIEIESARFFKPVIPGYILEGRCNCILQPERDFLNVNASCYSKDVKIAEVKMKFCVKNHD